MTTETNEYKGYTLFNDIDDPILKGWNRAAMAFNLGEDGKEDTLAGYLECFESKELMGVYAILCAIKARGLESVRKEVISGVKV